MTNDHTLTDLASTFDPGAALAQAMVTAAGFAVDGLDAAAIGPWADREETAYGLSLRMTLGIELVTNAVTHCADDLDSLWVWLVGAECINGAAVQS